MKNIVVLSGAGISAESGLKTFRDNDGLWENHNIREVATPQAFKRNPELVLRFYNERRKALNDVKPNRAHKELVKLEEKFRVSIITQNVDDLHERAGSSEVFHLHGNLTMMCSSVDPTLLYPYDKDIKVGDCCEKGSQLRPHVVWFGEAVPMIAIVQPIMQRADIVLVIGTSLQVYPAASLIENVPVGCDIYYIDPKPAINTSLAVMKNLHLVSENATIGVAETVEELLN